MKDASDRLIPKLQSLLAARLIKLSLNAKQSQLDFAAELKIEGNTDSLLGQAFTIRGSNPVKTLDRKIFNQIPQGTSFQFKISNLGNEDLYVAILIINPDSETQFLLPIKGTFEESLKLKSKEVRLFPIYDVDNFRYRANEKGVGEVLILASKSPLKSTVQRVISAERSNTPSVLDGVDGFFDDFTNARALRTKQTQGKQVYTSEIAALSITFQVV